MAKGELASHPCVFWVLITESRGHSMVSPVISQYAFTNNSLVFSIMVRIIGFKKALFMPLGVLEYGS